MIRFRCWYCGKCFAVPEARVGDQVVCGCKNTLRVPKRSGGNCRIKTLLDRLVEAVVYGGGGAFLGAGLGVLILACGRGRVMVETAWVLLQSLALAGLCVGLFGGEAGINWIGGLIRRREDDLR